MSTHSRIAARTEQHSPVPGEGLTPTTRRHLLRALATVATVALLASAASCQRRSGRYQVQTAPPPCLVDGVWQAQANRSYSSGSVCNLNDLQSLNENITIQRTGQTTVSVHQNGKYAHQANLDPYTCTIWTDRTPTHSRTVLGSTVSGFAGYRITVRQDGTLAGTLQLQVQSSSMLIQGCAATFSIYGRR